MNKLAGAKKQTLLSASLSLSLCVCVCVLFSWSLSRACLVKPSCSNGFSAHENSPTVSKQKSCFLVLPLGMPGDALELGASIVGTGTTMEGINQV